MSDNFFKALHAIQLEAIQTRELFIRLNGQINSDIASIYKDQIQIESGHSTFNKEEKSISVGLRLSLGMDEDTDLPISIRIEVMGLFNVNTDEFPEEHIESWAVKNAPMILYPFVREHGFSLTTRCGLPPALLPLLQVPTITAFK